MTPETWQRVKTIFAAAYERPPGERTRFLEEACGADPEVRAEVESLLSADVEGFLDAGALPTLTRLRAALADRYSVERELGRGGTATVYLAEDLRHHRSVAIKVLRPDLVAALGSSRFLREIEVTARLNHPHILPLLDSGEAAGFVYYAMPYVEGESLRDRLTREEQLPLDDALQIARDVGDALSYAHAHGVVHRDIKPENILLESGHAVVADFGIARAIKVAGGQQVTETGITLGTPAYMSPEQAAGSKDLDGRSDVYSLACVLYEMLSGEPPYTAPTPQAILAKKLSEPLPRISVVRETVHPTVEAALGKALARTPTDRFRTAGEFAAALSARALAVSDSPTATRRAPVPASRVIAGALGIAGLVSLALMLERGPFAPAASSTPQVRRQLTFSGDALRGVLSPDGQFLAYEASGGDSASIEIQDLGGGPSQTIGRFAEVNSLEWSPDGTQLLVGSLGYAAVLARLGGLIRTIPWPDQSFHVLANWRDGGHVSLHTYSSRRRILAYDLVTGDSVSVPVGGAYTWIVDGSWSPDGRTFAVATLSSDPINWAIRTVRLDGHTEVVVVDTVVLASPRWSPDGGALLYARGTDEIWGVSVSPNTGRAVGTPQAQHQHLGMVPLGPGHPVFALTRDGRRITYAAGAPYSNLWMIEPRGVRSPLALKSLTSGTAVLSGPAVSPDGRWIGFAKEAGGVAELFRMPLDGGPATQITFGARVACHNPPAWSPDGNQLAFMSRRAGRNQVWLADVEDGRLHALDRTSASEDLTWAPGAWIAYQNARNQNIVMLDPATGEERTVLRDTATGWVFNPRYSPTGDRLALFWARRSPRDFGVWIINLPSFSSKKQAGQPGLKLLPQGWSADGRYIYAQAGRILYRVDARSPRRVEPIVTLPWDDALCAPAGPQRPRAFVCAAFDHVSDIWVIEDSVSRAP